MAAIVVRYDSLDVYKRQGEKLLRHILEPYKGKLVLLDVWGTWCAPCKMALAHSKDCLLYTSSRMGCAVVRGLQGPEDTKYRKLWACAKHYAIHSLSLIHI